jgi:putative redox protein
MATVVVRGGLTTLGQDIAIDRHRLVADEPVAAGGTDTGPTPYDYLLVALGS